MKYNSFEELAKENALSRESVERKYRSEKILQNHNIPFNKWLPIIEDEEEVITRGKEEIARRAIALCIVAVKGEGLEQETVLKLIEKYDVKEYFSPKESEFIFNESPSKHERIQFCWRYECYWVMLWALGYIDELHYPSDICDVPRSVRILANSTIEEFIANSKVRRKREILDDADLIYRYHWAVVDARIKGEQMPGNLDQGVVMERHYALNWLIGYMDQEWDDISTDT